MNELKGLIKPDYVPKSGDWCKDRDCEGDLIIFKVTEIGEDGDIYGYGIDGRGEYSGLDKAGRTTWGNMNNCTTKSAAPEEVKTALVEYWERDNEGYERYLWCYDNSFGKEGKLYGYIGCNSYLLFDNGKWLPQKKKVMLNGFEVEYLNYISDGVKVNGYIITKGVLVEMYNIFETKLNVNSIQHEYWGELTKYKLKEIIDNFPNE